MTQADETIAALNEVELLATQAFAHLSTTISVQLNQIELLITRIGSDKLTEKQATLQPLTENLQNGLWEFKQQVAEYRGRL